MKNTDWTIRFFIYGLIIALVGILVFAFSNKVEASVFQFESGTNDTFFAVPVVDEDVVNYWYTINVDNGQSCVNLFEPIQLYVGDGTSTTTIENIGESAGDECSMSFVGQLTAGATGFMYFELDLDGSVGGDAIGTKALFLNETSLPTGGGGGSDSCNGDLSTHIGTDCVLYIENPVGNLFNGIMLLLITMGGVIWFFSRKRI